MMSHILLRGDSSTRKTGDRAAIPGDHDHLAGILLVWTRDIFVNLEEYHV
jgi:hypothetical protein